MTRDLASFIRDLEAFQSDWKGRDETVRAKVRSLVDASHGLDDKWSGSWVPAQACLYRVASGRRMARLTTPSLAEQGYRTINIPEMRTFVEQEANVTFRDFDEECERTWRQAVALRERIMPILAPLHRGLTAEEKLAKEIWDQTSGVGWKEAVRDEIPSTQVRPMGSDLRMEVPSHIVIRGEALSAYGKHVSAEILVRLLLRLVRQVEAGGQQVEPRTDALAQVTRVASLIGHSIRAMQKPRERHSGFEVKDEYDLQLLTGAVLKSYFDDVSPEDTTPKHAGAYALVDWIVAGTVAVEAKITRPGRGDRDLGGELLEDIGRYKQRPGLTSVVFIIYDPGHHLANPSRLMKDIESHSTPGFRVVCRVSH